MIEANLINSNASLIFALGFYDDNNNLLFVSDMCDMGKIDFGKISPGLIKLSVSIPVEILANRSYEAELICCLNKIGWILPPDNESRLKFDFFKDIDLNPYYNNSTNGLIAPVLKWRLEKIK